MPLLFQTSLIPVFGTWDSPPRSLLELLFSFLGFQNLQNFIPITLYVVQKSTNSLRRHIVNETCWCGYQSNCVATPPKKSTSPQEIWLIRAEQGVYWNCSSLHWTKLSLIEIEVFQSLSWNKNTIMSTDIEIKATAIPRSARNNQSERRFDNDQNLASENFRYIWSTVLWLLIFVFILSHKDCPFRNFG